MGTKNMNEGRSEGRKMKRRRCALDQGSMASKIGITLYVVPTLVYFKKRSKVLFFCFTNKAGCAFWGFV